MPFLITSNKLLVFGNNIQWRSFKSHHLEVVLWNDWRYCTTVWLHASNFTQKFPRWNIRPIYDLAGRSESHPWHGSPLARYQRFEHLTARTLQYPDIYKFFHSHVSARAFLKRPSWIEEKVVYASPQHVIFSFRWAFFNLLLNATALEKWNCCKFGEEERMNTPLSLWKTLERAEDSSLSPTVMDSVQRIKNADSVREEYYSTGRQCAHIKQKHNSQKWNKHLSLLHI